ncbi:hypothetical protein [Pseudoglutamicibacter albus]|uniref:Aminoglycoside phosphotransferase domain-containing protein n=1 Tax=Pseudoglutamicibacter albus TaxID=98671 RepID=A0ABU1Z3K4_9MICC|nr:hypothetical protein [Pseudoglutamicibacter albus]MDR7294586.1 hypothetical protein [Pseudoglutamicibacter albus]
MSEWEDTWKAAGWKDTARGWIQRALDTLGIECVARLKPVTATLAAAVYSIDTPEGTIYFKATAPARAAEATLSAHLAAVTKGHVPVPIAVEPEQGWILTPGIGTPLSDLMPQRQHGKRRSSALSPKEAEAATKLIGRVLTEASDLHQATATSQDRLMNLGALAYTDESWPDLYTDALDIHESMPDYHPLWIEPTTLDFLRRESRHLKDASAALASTKLPLVYNQLNPESRSILLPDSHRNPIMFVGWSGATFTNPLLAIAGIALELGNVLRTEPLQEPMRSLLVNYITPLAADSPVSPENLLDYLIPATLLAHVRNYLALMELMRDAPPETQTKYAGELRALLHYAVDSDPRHHNHRANGNSARANGAGRNGAGRNDTRANSAGGNGDGGNSDNRNGSSRNNASRSGASRNGRRHGRRSALS